MSDFITMVNRIATELRRSNMLGAIKNAVNDAVDREASQRFYFNEVVAARDAGYSFLTVPGTEYYADMGFVEVDAMYYYIGSTRYDIYPWGQRQADRAAVGGPVSSGQPVLFASAARRFRLYPAPTVAVTVYVDGYGRLTPTPLVADTDTNAWLSDGELLTRACAKAILLKDVIRDVAEATAFEAIAADYRAGFVDQTTLTASTGVLKPTQW